MIHTDALQTVIMVVGAVILAVKGEGWARVAVRTHPCWPAWDDGLRLLLPTGVQH